jgi:hypothetical protein
MINNSYHINYIVCLSRPPPLQTNIKAANRIYTLFYTEQEKDDAYAQFAQKAVLEKVSS